MIYLSIPLNISVLKWTNQSCGVNGIGYECVYFWLFTQIDRLKTNPPHNECVFDLSLYCCAWISLLAFWASLQLASHILMVLIKFNFIHQIHTIYMQTNNVSPIRLIAQFHSKLIKQKLKFSVENSFLSIKLPFPLHQISRFFSL